MLWQVRQHLTHNCHECIYKCYVQYLRGCAFFNLCLILMFGEFSCKNASIIATSFRIWGSVIYLSFLPKTCSSGIELIKSHSKILCTSQIFTFLSLPGRSETSSYLGPINLISEICYVLCIPTEFLSKFLIMTKCPFLYCGTSSHFSLFCLDWASLVFRAASI